MARPYWSGKIQISLVSFGVKLFVATEAASDIHFHLIDRRTGERVKHQNVASSAIERNPDEAADPVHKSDIVKGYEYSHGRYVTIEPDELAHLRVPSKRTMDVAQFVDFASIDPAFFEKPYFVVPEDDTQAEAFLTIRQALIDTKKIALSRIAFGGREHVIAIAPAPAHLSEKSTKPTKPRSRKIKIHRPTPPLPSASWPTPFAMPRNSATLPPISIPSSLTPSTPTRSPSPRNSSSARPQPSIPPSSPTATKPPSKSSSKPSSSTLPSPAKSPRPAPTAKSSTSWTPSASRSMIQRPQTLRPQR